MASDCGHGAQRGGYRCGETGGPCAGARCGAGGPVASAEDGRGLPTTDSGGGVLRHGE